MRQTLLILATLSAFGQATTPYKVSQSSGSLAGQLWLQEPRSGGTDWLKLRAGTLAADVTFTLPTADGTSGQCLQTDGAGQWQWEACSGTRLVSDYDWSQSPGGSIAIGPNTITLTPCPLSVAGSNTDHYIRLSGGTGTAEQVLITGGTCTSGAATGTITFTAASTHSGAWVAESASDGLQEAFYSVSGSGGILYLRARTGTHNIYSSAITGNRYITMVCEGPGTYFSAMADNVSIINSNGDGAIRVSGCSFNNPDLHANTTGILTYNAVGSSTGAYIVDNSFGNLAYGAHLATTNAIAAFSYNRFESITIAPVWIEQAGAGGDAGIGLIGPNNAFLDSSSVNAPYGILWNGPGNLKVQGNSFNGFVEQIHLEPKMGVVNIVGTAVTWVSGNKFRSSQVGFGFVADDTVADVVASFVSDTSITLTSNAVTCTGCSYYVGNTGQMQIMNNTLDSGVSTKYNVRFVGKVPFFNFQVNGNFTSNPNPTTYVAAVSVEGNGLYFGSIKHNNFQTSYVSSTKAVSLTSGHFIDVSDNQITNHLTGVTIGSGGDSHTVTDNHCVNTNTTNCVLSAAASTTINHLDPVTFAQLTALTVANSSRLYCSDCTATAGTCAGSGTGANATRINGAWKCEIGGTPNAWINGGNSFGADTNIGTNDNFAFTLKTNNLQRWFLTAADGHLYASTNNTKDIGAGITTNSPRSVYAATSMVSPAFSAIDSSGSYVRARKLEVHMDATGSSFFNWSFGTSNTLDLLDTASGVIQRWDRNTSDVSFDAHVWPRGTTETRNLGLTTARWLAVNTKNLNLSGNVTSDLTPTGTRYLGAAGSEWQEAFLNAAAITSIIEPKTNLGAQNGDSTKRWSTTYTQDLNASGVITFPTGTTGYVWTNTGSGVGGWAAAGACATCILNGGNTTGATLTIGTNDAQTLSLETNNVSYLQINSSGQTTIAGNVIPSGTRSLGITGTEWDSLYAGSAVITSVIEPKVNGGAQNGSSTKRWSNTYSVDGNYSGILTVGHTSAVVRLGQTLNLNYASDYAGMAINTWSATDGHGGVLDFNKSGSGTIGTHAAVVSAETLGFFVFRGSDGTAFQRAVEVNGEVDGAVSSGIVPGRLRIRTANSSGTMTERIRVDSAGLTTITGDLTITGTCTGCGSSTLPVADTTNIVKGSADATKLLRFEVDGFTTATTRTLTPQNNSYTIAGTDISQTFSNTQTFSGTLAVSGTVGDDFIPNSDGTYVNGTTSFRWGSLATYNADFNGVLTFQSGTTFTGSFLPTTNNLYAVGNTSFRLSNIATVNANISGTITTPSGSAGITSTKTVRDSAGTGTCTLIFSGGILTGGTC